MTAPWWKGAVVYQIYPRSFCDSDGDGIGDLPWHSLSKLDYVSALGPDAVWLSPIHPTLNKDFGYDVSDYGDVAAQMGGMPAFEALAAGMRQRGLKLILDEVLVHAALMVEVYLDDSCCLAFFHRVTITTDSTSSYKHHRLLKRRRVDNIPKRAANV